MGLDRGIIFSEPRFFHPVYNGSLPRGVQLEGWGLCARGMINETRQEKYVRRNWQSARAIGVSRLFEAGSTCETRSNRRNNAEDVD